MYKKKSLGQHFLHSAHYLGLIADTAHIRPGELVLEIGPGDGALTAELLKRGAKVVAIEKDHRLLPVLKEKFSEEIKKKKIILHEADILEVDIQKIIKGNYKLVANIPYYISGAIFKKFLSAAHQPSRMVLLVQKEVAERIARSKKESILSLSVKAYGAPAYIKTVPAGAFSPPPSVDSAILAINTISKSNFKNSALEERFFTIVRAGFAQKRKLLKRNLEPVLGSGALVRMQHAEIPEKARAEDVTLPHWLALMQ